MNDKARAKAKIHLYSEFIKSLWDEQKALEKLIETDKLNELDNAKARQRVFDLIVTIGGHEAFIREYQSRSNPATYRKTL
jgi:hypothetical protein